MLSVAPWPFWENSTLKVSANTFTFYFATQNHINFREKHWSEAWPGQAAFSTQDVGCSRLVIFFSSCVEV